MIQPALEGYPVGWFSPTYKMLADVWRNVLMVLRPVIKRVNAQEHRLELLTGGIVDMWSLDTPDIARGRKYHRVVIDEAAIVRALGDAWPAVIRPTLTDFEGDAWFLSTPKGRNYFYTLFARGQDPRQKDWASWQMPSSANPFLKSSEIEAMRADLPERIFAQEVLAEFLEDAGGVFRRVIDAATAIGQEQAMDGHGYIVGVDWGKFNDFTVFTVLDANSRSVVCLDRFNQIDYTTQVGRLMALCDRFRPVALVAERNSMGEPLIEQLQRMGLPVYPFTTTVASKQIAIDALALAFERGEIKIIPDQTLISELQAYEAMRLPSGMLRYGAPEGMHDDCVMSLALAWQALVTPTDQTLVYDDRVEISPF